MALGMFAVYRPAHQTFSSNSLDLSAPAEAYSRNVRASGTLKFGYEGVFKIRILFRRVSFYFISVGFKLNMCAGALIIHNV